MHDTGTIVGGGVVGQVHRRQAVITRIHCGQRMAEVDAGQRFAQGGGDYRACELVTLQARVHQARGQQQQAARRVHQRVRQFGIQVQRLVGRNGPRGRGPDHGKSGLGQLVETKCRCQALGLGAQKTHIHRVRLLVGVFDFELGQ